MINLYSVSVENIHRIQRKPPLSGPGLLEHQNLMRDRGYGNYPVPNPEPAEYETTNRSTQTLAPVEKKPMGGLFSFDQGYMFQKNKEKDLGTRRKDDKKKYVKTYDPNLRDRYKKLKKVKESSITLFSQQTQDIVSVISASFANVSSVLGNERSDGSGFFINKNYLVTASHVVFLSSNFNRNKQVVQSVQVGINVGGNFYNAKLAAYDALRDFAIIYVDSESLGISEIIHPINLGNSSNVRAGESVILLGNPIANSIGQPTATYGIVSLGADIAERGMFVVDAEALEGMSGGMVYSATRHAVVGIVVGYFTNNAQAGGGTTLTICTGIDGVKNVSKKNKIPFTYREASKDSNIVLGTNYGSTIKDDDEYVYNESVGVMGGPGKTRRNKNKRKGFEQSVTQGPGNKSIPVNLMYHPLQTRELYQERPSVMSSPFDNVPEDVKKLPGVKNKIEQTDDSKGEWMFSIPLNYKNHGENNINVFKVDENTFVAFYEGKKIAESKKTEQNPIPLADLLKKIREKYTFDKTYQSYIEDFGHGILQ